MFSGYRSKVDIMSDTPHEAAKMIAHCTVEYERGGDQIVRYQDTDIITTKPNGHMILNSGGYRTPTTKARINDRLKYGSIYQDASIWYYAKGNYWTDGREAIVFYDNMRINSKGTVTGRKPKRETIERKIKALKKQIAGFVKLLDDNLPEPSSGDCWYCHMVTADDQTPFGDATGNHDHLKSHIKEGYLHGSLLVNAMKEAGYEDRQIPFHYMLAQKGDRDFFKRALRKYLFKRLSQEIIQ